MNHAYQVIPLLLLLPFLITGQSQLDHELSLKNSTHLHESSITTSDTGVNRIGACSDYVYDTLGSIINQDTSAKIAVISNGIVQIGNDINYHAGEYVELIHDFKVEEGAIFHAYIVPCEDGPIRLLTPASTTRQAYADMPVSLPGYLQSYYDPIFGGKVTRITGDAGTVAGSSTSTWTSQNRHQYSSVSAWNRDGSKMLVRAKGSTQVSGAGAPEWILLDGNSYQVIRNLYPTNSIGQPIQEMRWDPSDPNRLICVGGNELFYWDCQTQARTTITTIGSSRLYIGPYSGEISKDGSKVVLTNGNLRQTSGYTAYLVNLPSGNVISQKTYTEYDTDYITISPSGNCIVWNGATVNGQWDRIKTYDTNFNLKQNFPEFAYPSHYDIGFDASGNEVITGVSYNPGVTDGDIVSRDPETGAVVSQNTDTFPIKTSMRNIDNPGWAFPTYASRVIPPPFQDEVGKIFLDGTGSTFERWAQMHSTNATEESQPDVCPNPSGTCAAFASDWGIQGGAVHTFVVCCQE